MGINEENELNTNSDNEEILKAKSELEETKMQELRIIEEEIRNKIGISDKIEELDPLKLYQHPLNSRIYGKIEENDETLIQSFLKFEQLEPILFYHDEKTDRDIIVSGHRRVSAAISINKQQRKRLVLKPGSFKEYEEGEYIDFKVKGIRIKFLSDELQVLLLIDANKYRNKLPSQKINEIRELIRIFSAEGKKLRNEKLRQYAVSSDLKKRHKKPRDSTLDEEEYYGKQFDEGNITEDDVRSSILYKKDEKKDDYDTYKKIHEITGESVGNIHKYKKLGECADDKTDEVWSEIIKFLDFDRISLNTAYNLCRLRNIQKKFGPTSKLYGDLEIRIQNILEASPESTGNIITDNEVRKFQDILDDIKLKNGKKNPNRNYKFPINLIEPADSPKITEKFNISAPSTSALFIIATHNNLDGCISLMKANRYLYQTFYHFEDKLVLLGIKGEENFLPEILQDNIESRDELYSKIMQYYPNQNYHKVRPKNHEEKPPKNAHEEPSKVEPSEVEPSEEEPSEVESTEVEPPGWEIPIGENLTIRELNENKRLAIKEKDRKRTEELSKKEIAAEKKLKAATDEVKKLRDQLKKVNEGARTSKARKPSTTTKKKLTSSKNSNSTKNSEPGEGQA